MRYVHRKEDATKTTVNTLYIKGLVTRKLADKYGEEVVYRAESGLQNQIGWLLYKEESTRYPTMFFDKVNEQAHRGTGTFGFPASDVDRVWNVNIGLIKYIQVDEHEGSEL